jgi:hypothetical protein
MLHPCGGANRTRSTKKTRRPGFIPQLRIRGTLRDFFDFGLAFDFYFGGGLFLGASAFQVVS